MGAEVRQQWVGSRTKMTGRHLIQKKRGVIDLVSAGGVVYRVGGAGVEVVICGRTTPPTWGLPKGTPNQGETREETAHREVNEETGLEIKIEQYIGGIEYWFSRPNDGMRCHKKVLYYLMSPIGGDVSLHDHEFDFVQWVSVDDAVSMLTYQNEVGIIEDALYLVSKVPKEPRSH